MRYRHLTVSLLTLAAAATAQSETSPKGFLTTEGSWSDQGLLGYNSTAYGYGTSYLHVDATNVGQARTLKMLSMRRDGTTPTNTAYVARTVKMSIRMSYADWNQIKGNTPQTESEFLVAGWSTVMTDKTVSLPDFTQKPAAGTAPFNVLLPLDTSFPYNGSNAIAIQILTSPNTDLTANSTPYPLDYVYQGPSIAKQGEYGIGCTPTGKSQPMNHNSQLRSHGPNGISEWTLDVTYGPASAPVVTVLGLSNPSLDFGACGKLFAWPDVTLNGTTNSAGSLALKLEFAHRAEFVGVKAYSQSAAYDAGMAPLPIVMSKGMSVVYPVDPIQPKVANSGKTLLWYSVAWPTDHRFVRGTAIPLGLHE